MNARAIWNLSFEIFLYLKDYLIHVVSYQTHSKLIILFFFSTASEVPFYSFRAFSRYYLLSMQNLGYDIQDVNEHRFHQCICLSFFDSSLIDFHGFKELVPFPGTVSL